jgi:UDP-N-acetyl-2-amino-2-deoxyglucuronate dehydrogenase
MTIRRRVGLIGLGMAVSPHARSLVDLQAAGRVEVAGAWSRTPARRAAFAERFALPVTDDLDGLIADPSVTAVLLLTPPDARDDLVARLSAAGKHILMEKPVERTTAAALRIVAACEQAGVRLGIVFQHRFREGSLRLRALHAAGALGELALVQLAVPWWRPQSYYDQPGRGTIARDGGGVLISQAIHSLDLMLSLTGPVAEVAAVTGTSRLHRMETEDVVGAGLRFENGALGSLIATTACYPGMPERLVLTGTKGTAVLEAGTLAVDFLDGRSERFGETAGGGGGADPMAFPHDWHERLITDFLDALDEDRPPRIPGREALRVHRLIDALLESGRERRAVTVAPPV